MRVLIIGGTGLISTGIIKHLLARRASVTMLNRGKRENRIEGDVDAIVGDRHQRAVLDDAARHGFDAVIDMCCFTPAAARDALDAFSGKTAQYIFCSTVCTYGVKVPPGVLVDETFPQEPISDYGRNKLACERLVLEYHQAGRLAGTIIRPSHTYGPGNPMLDNIDYDSVAWDRIMKDRPVLCSDSGMGLWVSTHRDDCGKAFAYAVLNERTFGQAYNTTRDEQHTWREHYRQIASVLGKPARLVFMPSAWIAANDAARFTLLREITAHHGAYSSEKAKRDIPEFRCEIDLPTGAAEVFADQRRRNAWKNSDGDALYDGMVERAMAAGVLPVEA